MSQELINYEDKKTIETLKATVAKNATDAEFQMFAGLCKATGLNPFKREVWFIKVGDTPQIMTGLNGFLAIANNHPAYDGMEVEYGEQIVVEAKAQKIPVPAWVEVKVYRKDRSRPQSARAYWREYAKDLVGRNGGLTIWAKMPSVMLAKCAESMALRKAFPQELNGLYTQEEMPKEYSLAEAATTNKYAAFDAACEEVMQAQEPTIPLEDYIIESTDNILSGMLLSEVPVEAFKELEKESFKNLFSQKDLNALRAYYKKHIYKSNVSKKAQQERREELKKQAQQLQEETHE